MSVEETSAEVPASRASQLPTALIGLAFLVVAIVFAASSSWYDTFLAVHILFVVIWIGGGLFLTLFGILAEKGPQAPETLAAISEILLIARVDMAVLGLVIVDMVTKPFS